MEVFSENRKSHLTVEVTEGEFVYYPSLNLFVTISDEGFCEARGHAWVTIGNCTDFVAASRSCEQTRRGRAVLSGTSPGEFEIAIESCDSVGHFRLQYKLTHGVYSWGAYHEKTVSGVFDLDSGCFAQTVAGFAELLPADPH